MKFYTKKYKFSLKNQYIALCLSDFLQTKKIERNKPNFKFLLNRQNGTIVSENTKSISEQCQIVLIVALVLCMSSVISKETDKTYPPCNCMFKVVSRNDDLDVLHPFHAIGFFLYPMETSENQSFSDVFKGYRKRAVT